jgi:hypothetical protein
MAVVLYRALEDRGIGRQPCDGEFTDIARQRPSLEKPAGNVVEPETLAEVAKVLCGADVVSCSWTADGS